eukprot:5341860-Amphidinium_carterae.1
MHLKQRVRNEKWQAYKQRTHPVRVLAKAAMADVLPLHAGLVARGGKSILMTQSAIHKELHDFWGGELPLSLEALRAAIAHMGRGKAAGGDGWRGEELAWLDDGFLHLLLRFMMCCEHNHSWPRSIEHQVVAFIPKPQHVNSALQADHLRPICLLSHIYKLWFSLRLPLFRVAMDQMPSNIVGSRRRVHIHRLAAEINLDLDVAEAAGLTLYGCHCDVAKAYEGAQHTQLEHCSSVMALPGGHLLPFHAHGALGEATQRSGGP